MRAESWFLVGCLWMTGAALSEHAVALVVDRDAEPVERFGEQEGRITIEAEQFVRQDHASPRAWRIWSSSDSQASEPDGDPPHLEGASDGAYIEALPDTRRTHDDRLINGENFSPAPGKMAVLAYPIHVTTGGRYYVWARTYSTGSEDNGLHFGIDGQWPESGQRWQTIKKNGWHWDCKQRTTDVHTGVPMQLWLDIPEPGDHELLLAMREDGAEVDQIILAHSAEFRPQGVDYQVDAASSAAANTATVAVSRQPDGDGSVTMISGELKQWHKVTLTLDGPFAHEFDGKAIGASELRREVGAGLPNPFTDLAFSVTFTHESGTPSYQVPGYFAADGDAANSGSQAGTQWRAHLSPDLPGRWNYVLSFRKGALAALDGGGQSVAPFDGQSGAFVVEAGDKTGRDFRAHGRLSYVGRHHLQFAGSKEYFLKAGPDAPETMLAFADFDGTEPGRKQEPRTGEAAPVQRLKTWSPHLRDWQPGDPVWRGDKGKGLIGGLNYLTGKGLNAVSFLTYNVSGDGDNVWPFAERESKLHYDCSKLDQWGIVFDHATARGLYLHFKLQENELDDNRRGDKREEGSVPASLDGGKLGPERKLYCRELIARFGHALALNWNIGEENTQSSDEIRAMAKYLHDTDPYQHHIVVHTFPPQQDQVYQPLLGDQSVLTGVSLQNSWRDVHARTLHWVRASAAAGRPWVVANDEQNPASLGVPPDPGYEGHDGVALERRPDGQSNRSQAKPYTLHDIRKRTLWGNLMAGGAGVEYYFGYQLPENDLVCEDWRSRDRSWDYCRVALELFRNEAIPFWEMSSADALVTNVSEPDAAGRVERTCLAKPGEVYLIYLPSGGDAAIDLSGAQGEYTVSWYDPRGGGKLRTGAVASVRGGNRVELGSAPSEPSEDWVVVVRVKPER